MCSFFAFYMHSGINIMKFGKHFYHIIYCLMIFVVGVTIIVYKLFFCFLLTTFAGYLAKKLNV